MAKVGILEYGYMLLPKKETIMPELEVNVAATDLDRQGLRASG